MTNAIIYSRISHDRTGEAAGVQRQEDDARKLAEARGWTVIGVEIDNDISAAGHKKRPGFENVLDALRQGRATVVVAWALDRLTRNRRDTVRLVETAQAAGATIALVRGSDMDMSTPSGRMIADLLAAVARAEIETKSDRQRRAVQQRVEAGLPTGGRRAFGYEPGGMVIREDEAEFVRKAYEWLLSGVPLRQIAIRWNEAGMATPQPTKDGGPKWWNGGTVSRCLKKARYAGLRSYHGEVTGPAAWPAIVDVETWQAAQALMGDPKRKPPKSDQKLLTGVAKCGKCGATVFAGGGAPGRGVYRCRARSCVCRRRAIVDEYIRAIVIERLSRPDTILLLQGAEDEGPSIGDLAAEIGALRSRLEPLAQAYAEGAISILQLRRGTDQINAQIDKLEQEISRASSSGLSDLAAVIGADDVEAAWDNLTTDAQRNFIDELMEIKLFPVGQGRTGLHPETIEITWKA